MNRRNNRRRLALVPNSLPARSQRIPRQLRAEINGRVYTPRRTPPSIVEVPWNQIVCTVRTNSDVSPLVPTALNSQLIYLALTRQLGLFDLGPPRLEIRFSRVECWAFGDASSLIMDVYPLNTLSTSDLAGKIARLEDTPGKNQWACVGYEWARAHSLYVYSLAGASATAIPIMQYYVDVASTTVWTRFHMMWRTSPDYPPSLLGVLPVFRSPSHISSCEEAVESNSFENLTIC